MFPFLLGDKLSNCCLFISLIFNSFCSSRGVTYVAIFSGRTICSNKFFFVLVLGDGGALLIFMPFTVCSSSWFCLSFSRYYRSNHIDECKTPKLICSRKIWKTRFYKGLSINFSAFSTNKILFRHLIFILFSNILHPFMWLDIYKNA